MSVDGTNSPPDPHEDTDFLANLLESQDIESLFSATAADRPKGVSAADPDAAEVLEALTALDTSRLDADSPLRAIADVVAASATSEPLQIVSGFVGTEPMTTFLNSIPWTGAAQPMRPAKSHSDAAPSHSRRDPGASEVTSFLHGIDWDRTKARAEATAKAEATAQAEATAKAKAFTSPFPAQKPAPPGGAGFTPSSGGALDW